MSDDAERADIRSDLVAYVQRQAADKANAILEDARARAAEIERQAFAEARARLDTVKRQERLRARELCRAAEARMHAKLASRRRELDGRRLALLQRQFLSVLEEFWRTPAVREAWVRAAFARAAAGFGVKGWTVELSGPEETELADRVRELAAGDTKIVALENDSPGLRVRCGDAVLDATAEGFLSRGGRIDALLLAALEDSAGGGKG